MAGLLLPGGPAAAHDTEPSVLIVLDEVTPAVPGVMASVRASIVTELTVDNRSGEPVEVLDDAGRPFLRIAPQGVDADLWRAAWYVASDPSGAGRAVPADAPTGWTRVSDGSSWSWFEHRMHRPGTGVPPELVAAGEPADIGSWTVPIRVGGEPGEIRGRVRFEPLAGVITPLLTGDRTLPRGARISLLAGRVPGFFLELGEADEITVIGRSGEPMARLDADGASANLASPSWHDYVHMAPALERPGTPADPDAAPVWERLDAPVLTWLDSRGTYPEQRPPDAVVAAGRPATLVAWDLPLVVDGERVVLSGETRWQPLEDAAAQGPAADPLRWVLAGIGVALVVAAAWRRRRPAGDAAGGPGAG